MSTERKRLLESKGLALYDELGPPYRELWLSGDFQIWAENDLSEATPPASQGGRWWGTEEPVEQVYAAFEAYAYDPAYKGGSVLVNIRPQSNGVWELKTPDVRVFGWFYRYRVFIGHIGAFKGNVDYEACRAAVRNFHRALKLPQPAFYYVKGGKPSDYF